MSAKKYVLDPVQFSGKFNFGQLAYLKVPLRFAALQICLEISAENDNQQNNL